MEATREPNCPRPDPNERRAAVGAQMREEDWSHPTDPREGPMATERLACDDPYCRFCKYRDGEVLDGFNV